MKLHWKLFSTRRPAEAACEKAEIDTKPPFLHPELPDRVRMFGSLLGLHELCDCSCVRTIVMDAATRVSAKHAKSLHRAACEHPELCGELHRVLGMREACKVLAGKTYKCHIRRAIEASDAARREEMFEQAMRLLEPDPDTCEHIDPAAYLDPSTWPVESISVRCRREIHLRLALLASAMLCQEKCLEDNDRTVGDAVLDAVQERVKLTAKVDAELEAMALA